MKLLTEAAVLRCDHRANVHLAPRQDYVRIVGQRILSRPDPEDRPIAMCTNIGATLKPCTKTGPVDVGYSTLLSIDGFPICLDSVNGLTNGTPPDTVHYTVNAPGQDWVEAAL